MDLIIRLKFYFITFFMFSVSFVSPLVSSNVVPKGGHCVMYDRCEGENVEAPCVYNGPPKPLDKTTPLSVNMTAVELLMALCPDFVNDKDPHVCCSTSQLAAFHIQMMMVEGLGFSRCQSCMQNFRKIVCYMSCSPHQSHFLNVTRSYKNEDGEEIVGEVNYYVSKNYAYTLYDSCKDLQGITPGTYIMDYVCGSWGSAKCNAERWTEYMGSTAEEGAYSPFKTNYILTTEDIIHTADGLMFYPMNATSYKCSESPGPGYEPCSCNDCRDSCSLDFRKAPELEPLPEPFRIFIFDGPTVVAAIAFIFLWIIATIFYCFCKKPNIPQQSYVSHRNGMSNNDGNLGSLDEIKPLRSKAGPKIISESERRELANKPSRFQLASICLEERIERSFVIWSHFVYRRPLTVMILSLFVCMFLSSGLLFHFDITTNPVDLWVSPHSHARQDMEYFNKHFG